MVLGFSREKEPIGDNSIYLDLERFIFRTGLTLLWKLTSPKSAGQAGRLEMKGRANFPV